MNKLKLFFLFLLASKLFSCAYSEEFKDVNFENIFVISMPDYMKECDDLSPEAELQYKNAYRNTYCIINVEEKGNQTLEEYQHKTFAVLKNYELLNNTLVTDSFYRSNDNFQAIDIQMYGVMDNENIYYWHSTFESAGKFYEVVCWTRSMDRKQRYGPDIEKIIASFKALN